MQFGLSRGRAPTAASLAPAMVAAVVALIVVGPVLRRGVALSYDLAWSPDPRFTPYAVGAADTAPRAVPSDAFAIALGHLVGAGVAQALVLWGILLLAGWGAGRLAHLLAPEIGMGGRLVAVIAGIWNPFVLERLVVGHWTVLLAYAAVPHLWIACVRVRQGSSPPWAPAVGLAACGLGGANALVISTLAVLTVLIVPKPRWLALGYSLLALVGVSCAWALPALLSGVASAPQGVAAFAARADTPLGVLGSLFTGGGFWNVATHPAERSALLIAIGALALVALAQLIGLRAARRSRLLMLAVPGVVGLIAAWMSAVDPFGFWSSLVTGLPGGGILRDAQKLLAPWMVFTAAGLGVLADQVRRVRQAGPALAVLVAALPVALLPSLAWGVSGRVSAVEVPTELRVVADQLSGSTPGTVGLLPWSQYRRYAWNGDRVSLTLVPRMVSQRVLFDDSLPLSDGTVDGEDVAAQRVTGRIRDGVDPAQALAAEGVRWILIEKQVGLESGVDSGLPDGATVIHDGPAVQLIELSTAPSASTIRHPRALWWGWSVTCVTLALALACCLRQMTRRRSDRLVGSAP